MMGYLNLAAIKECTVAEGPGKRFAIWTQGCLKRCKNCCNLSMQIIEKKHIVESSDLIELIQKAQVIHDIEGISLIGGEPFLQAKGLVEVAKWCQEHDLSVIAFTGYEFEELREGLLPYSTTLLEYIDILIDGEFVEELYDEDRAWVGSKNQRVRYLTRRYTKGIEYEQKEKTVEICISGEHISINGWPFNLS